MKYFNKNSEGDEDRQPSKIARYIKLLVISLIVLTVFSFLITVSFDFIPCKYQQFREGVSFGLPFTDQNVSVSNVSSNRTVCNTTYLSWDYLFSNKYFNKELNEFNADSASGWELIYIIFKSVPQLMILVILTLAWYFKFFNIFTPPVPLKGWVAFLLAFLVAAGSMVYLLGMDGLIIRSGGLYFKEIC